MIYFKNEIAATALFLSLIPAAQANTCFGADCGVVFTSIGDIPFLDNSNCGDPGSGPIVSYTLQNQASTGVTINLTLTELDELDDPTAVTFVSGGLGSCTPDGGTIVAGNSCTVNLRFQPCETGELDWDLTVTPVSTQRPLVLELTAEVNPAYFAYAYVVNSNVAPDSGGLSSCGVNDDGTFAACQTVAFTFDSEAPGEFFSIEINPSQPIAYLSSPGSSSLTTCPIIDPYTFGSVDTPCTVSTDSDQFNTISGLFYFSGETDNLFAVVQGTQTVLACPVLDDGTLDTCVIANNTHVDSDATNFYIFVNDDSDEFGYVTNNTSDTVTFFTLVGTELTYTTTDLSIDSPFGMARYSDTASIITDYALNEVTVCTTNDDGSLTDCASYSDDSFISPSGVIAPGTNDIYITNEGANLDSGYQVSFCDSSLTCSALTDPTFSVPSDITFIIND